jgi:diaminopimelate decarboxylase
MNPIAYFKERTQLIRKQKSRLMGIAREAGTPLYLYDPEEVKKNVRRFKKAFQKQGIDLFLFYATKSNYYPGILKTIVEEGEGLDVSSQRELILAVRAGAKRIIYTGPVKTEQDFEAILQNPEKITVNLESLRELELLASMAKKRNVRIRCGVRIYTRMQAGWTKFGIPLDDFPKFFHSAQKHSSLNFCGIHFHISFNKNPEKYVKTLKELSRYLQTHLTQKDRQKIEYLDMGGGFYPEPFEALYAWNPEQSSEVPDSAMLERILNDHFHPRILPIQSEPIEIFAAKIEGAFKSAVKPVLPNARLYAEPGRYLSHSAMHFLLKLVEVKNPRMGITDGGTNMIGWEKYQHYDYVPMFNLSQLDLKNEFPFLSYGSLCTPEDIWGYYLFSKASPKNGDILLIPHQGAYTYTLAQQFIKDIPGVYEIG